MIGQAHIHTSENKTQLTSESRSLCAARPRTSPAECRHPGRVRQPVTFTTDECLSGKGEGEGESV